MSAWSVVNSGELRALPVLGIRDVFPRDSVAKLVVDALALGGLRFHDGDILVVKHKIVSKAEGRMVALDSVKPSAAARSFARDNGTVQLYEPGPDLRGQCHVPL